jgi:hypothetical protein
MLSGISYTEKRGFFPEQLGQMSLKAGNRLEARGDRRGGKEWAMMNRKVTQDDIIYFVVTDRFFGRNKRTAEPAFRWKGWLLRGKTEEQGILMMAGTGPQVKLFGLQIGNYYQNQWAEFFWAYR